MKRTVLVVFFLMMVSGVFASTSDKLLEAVLANRFSDVKAAVEKGANVNVHYDKGRTALHWAVLGGNLKIVVYLVSKGADVNARDKVRATPLHNAAMQNNLELVKYLVLKGADINAADQYGWTPLHYFTYYQNALIVKYMIMQEASLTNRSTREFMKVPAHSTPLDIAIRMNSSNIIQALEDPDRYMGLLNRPSFALYPELSFGSDRRLSALESGEIRVTVSNKGGGNAPHVELEMEGLSNTVALTFDTNIDAGYLSPASYRTLSFKVRGLRALPEGTAHVRLRARETTLPKESPWVGLELPLAGWLPADFTVSVAPEGSGFRAGEEGFLKLSVSNSGQGYAEGFGLRVFEVSNADSLHFGSVSNPALFAPGQTAQYRIPVKVPPEDTDRTAALAVEIVESNAAPRVLLAGTVPVLHMLKPDLRTTLIFKPVFTYQTNFTTNEIPGLSNLPPVLEVLTNLVASSETNYEPYLTLSNAGEGTARYLTVELLMSVSGSQPSESGPKPVVYRVPEILPGAWKYLRYPALLQGDVKDPGLEMRVRGNDLKRTATVETNLRVVLP